MKIVTLLLLVMLLCVAYYDFKYMAVPLFILLCTVVLSFVRLLVLNKPEKGLLFAGMNIMGCMLIILLSFLIIFIIRSKVFNPLNVLIGVGDLVFFPAVCFSFSPVNFILFFILSLTIVLVLKPLTYRSKSTLPLAGGISALMFFVLIAGILFPVNSYSDAYILNLLFN